MVPSPRTVSRSLAAASAAVVGLCLVVPGIASATGSSAAPTPRPKAPTYQDFYNSTHRDADGQWIVDGDTPMKSAPALKNFFKRVTSPDLPSGTDRLIVNQVNGKDDVWSASQVGNLTYCVSDKFGPIKEDVATAMRQGGGLWSAASSKIRFVHDATQDATCSTANTKVVFSVEPIAKAPYIARAFFPSSAKSERNILVNLSDWGKGSWEAKNVLGHEMGHILGLRHEHTRPEAGKCFEDNNWRPLTPYDSASIMHYPHCNGTSKELSFTESDGVGIRKLYGK
ncbi:hypothetical protein KEM60_02720 [Austwickia sp. TVS 96-490-7B]|uniref:matrixin family metalloprotease n=1 Tax=Austwickia sp. TVS 96-490-7B TaxID=2830843 RepID=UPI001D21871E|nr:matrixin family metalloprotease [Austwickia sp. TVS 96-490-7B]MBW3086499.1 hypothetical protein [Austwickia sp. TVS 96-490-7B]